MFSSEVMCTVSSETMSIIDYLEKGSYLKRNYYDKDEVEAKIVEFSSWFNTARLYFLQSSDPQETETYVSLLLDLQMKLSGALNELSNKRSNRTYVFNCAVCGEELTIKRQQNCWSSLQDHSHFEQTYLEGIEMTSKKLRESANNVVKPIENDVKPIKPIENGTSPSSSQSSGASSSCAPAQLNEEPRPKRAHNLNNFKFNFVIKYHPKIEEAYYPKNLITAAQKHDKLEDYTIQRWNAVTCVCLLCQCPLAYNASKVKAIAVQNHAAGQRHLRFAKTAVNRSALSNYHEFWRKQEPSIQAHQQHFRPLVDLSPQQVRCHLCQETVQYSAVLDHILKSKHKNKVFKLVLEGKDCYLLKMQVGIYSANGEKYPSTLEAPAKAAALAVSCKFIKFECTDLCGTDVFELPPRYSDHSVFFIKGKGWAECEICEEKFSGGLKTMKSHVLTNKHRELSGLDYNTYKFYCEICQVFMDDEAGWDNHFVKESKRHSTVVAPRKVKLAEFECRPCMTIIFGDELSLIRHINARVDDKKPPEVKLPQLVKKLFNNHRLLEEEANRMQIEAKEVSNHQAKMKICCAALEKALFELYPHCSAHPFGSRISGLGNHSSDLDVFLDIRDMYTGKYNQDALTQERYVKLASKELKLLKEEFLNVVAIPSARTPIVKVFHCNTRLDCDISFRHGLGVENTKFIRFCIELQPITQPFILLLKKWSDICKLNEHIPNYGLALMGVFYLQTEGYLLSVTTVREFNPEVSLVIDGWETLNYTMSIEKMRKHIKIYTFGIKHLLRAFFYYFAKFDYANNVVCPLMGTTIAKLHFNEQPHENLPREMSSYLQRIRIDNSQQFRGFTPFCIQDPFDLSHNLVKACNHATISKLKTLCTLTYEHLDSIA